MDMGTTETVSHIRIDQTFLDDVLNFIDNHDNQRSEPPNVATYKDGNAYKLAVGYMLAWPYVIIALPSHKF